MPILPILLSYQHQLLARLGSCKSPAISQICILLQQSSQVMPQALTKSYRAEAPSAIQNIIMREDGTLCPCLFKENPEQSRSFSPVWFCLVWYVFFNFCSFCIKSSGSLESPHEFSAESPIDTSGIHILPVLIELLPTRQHSSHREVQPADFLLETLPESSCPTAKKTLYLGRIQGCGN